MMREGFLMLNSSLVFRSNVSPKKEAVAWQPFMEVLLENISEFVKKNDSTPPILVLWGKVAEKLKKIPISRCFSQIISEHPYNLSFIKNNQMHSLFRPMKLLQRSSVTCMDY
jgi:uracil-DNA glycosylase